MFIDTQLFLYRFIYCGLASCLSNMKQPLNNYIDQMIYSPSKFAKVRFSNIRDRENLNICWSTLVIKRLVKQ